jgi:hypothetical protein
MKYVQIQIPGNDCSDPVCPEPGVDPVVGEWEHQEGDDDRGQGGVEHLGTQLVRGLN